VTLSTLVLSPFVVKSPGCERRVAVDFTVLDAGPLVTIFVPPVVFPLQPRLSAGLLPGRSTFGRVGLSQIETDFLRFLVWLGRAGAGRA